MNAIETRGLTKYYGKSRGIVDVNLSVLKGEVFGFIGPNGAGKSTTIRTLLAFLRPTRGSAKVFNMDCISMSHEIKKRIGYVPSEVNFYDDMKVKDLLQYSAKLHRKKCKKKTDELIEQLELDINKKINTLSSGNKKKVAVIQALMHEPELLILDEPTGGLDPLMQNKLYKILEEEKKRGGTVFFSSHILSEVQRICDRVAIIREGKIAKIETVDKLRADRQKKIRIVFGKNNIQQGFNIEGVHDCKVKENTMEFIYSGRINPVIKELSRRDIDNIWIDEPSLEEIFMHYYEKEGK